MFTKFFCALLAVLVVVLVVSEACMAFSIRKSLELPAEALSELSLSAEDIAVVVKGSSDMNLMAVLVADFPKWPEEAATKYLDMNLVFFLKGKGNRAILQARLGDKGHDFGNSLDDIWRSLRGESMAHPHLRLEISVPEKLLVNIKHGGSDLLISAVKGALVIEQGIGSVNMSDVGDIIVNQGSGSISLVGGKGTGKIVSGSGKVEVLNSSGEYFINNGGGPLTVSSFNGSLSINNGTGSLQVEKVTGPLQISDSLGDVDIRDVHGEVTMVAGGGKGHIKIDKVTGKTDVTVKRRGPISINDVGAAFTLTSIGKLDKREQVEIHNVKQGVLLHNIDPGSINMSSINGEIVYK